MKTKEWLGGKKGWDFIRENNNIMSPAEMADYFGITTDELTREKFEMGITIDFDGSNCENELHRCLNRFERAHTWGTDAIIALREHTHTMPRKKNMKIINLILDFTKKVCNKHITFSA